MRKMHKNILIFVFTLMALAIAGCSSIHHKHHKQHPHKRFEILDVNNDKVLDRFEFGKGTGHLFDKIDYDNNGVITKNEFILHQDKARFRRR